MELGVDIPSLERIKKDHEESLDCQRKMITEWLDSGKASWRGLVRGLTSPLLINYHHVAVRIAKAHPTLPQ